MAPGGRSGGSEKILPICARAGGASEIVVAATRAAKPVRAMVRNISRLQKANRARDIVQTYPPLACPPVNTPNTAGKGRFPPPLRHWSAPAADEIVASIGLHAGPMRGNRQNPG